MSIAKIKANCEKLIIALRENGAVVGSVINNALLDKLIRMQIGINPATLKIYKQVMQDFGYLKIAADGWTVEKLEA